MSALLALYRAQPWSHSELATADADGCSTTYFSPFVRECFCGVLELTLLGASDLTAGQFAGVRNPYVVASIGDSAYRFRTQLFTRSPSWNETCRLFVRDVTQTVKLVVKDADMLKEDGTLGVAMLALADIRNGTPIELELPIDSDDEELGGSLLIRLTFSAFSPPPPPLSLPEPVAAWWELLSSASARRGRALGALFSSVAAMADPERDELRRRAEAELWAVPRDSDWAVLASSLASVALPSEFEKLAFICHEGTDTQCSIWRCVAQRLIVVAFRGTDQTMLVDLITDARLMPRRYSPQWTGWRNAEEENAGDYGAVPPSGEDAEDAPAVHDGFLSAFEAVRGRVLAAVDDARGACPRAAALGRHPSGEWGVCVTGHSLGGALATLCAMELAASVRSGARRGLRVSMTNFGSPRVGNEAFCRLYNGLVMDSIRVVNGTDAVPTVPALMGYRHVAHGVRISGSGAAVGEVAPALATPPVAGGSVAAMAAAALSGAVQAGAIEEQEAAEAAAALAALADSTALESHFELQYLAALQKALQVSAALQGE